MAARNLFKALLLPMLGLLLISASTVAVVLWSGVTHTVLWVDGSADAIALLVDGNKVDGKVFLENVPIPEGVETLACARSSNKLTVQSGSAVSFELGALNASLAGIGVTQCTSPSILSNQPAKDSSRWGKMFTGWEWLMTLTLSAAVVWAIYRRGMGTNVALRPAQTISVGRSTLCGLAAGSLLFGVNFILWNAAGYEPYVYPNLLGQAEPSVALLLSMALVIPFIEETSFRAWLIPLASTSLGKAGAVALSTIAFAACHNVSDWPSALFYLCGGTIFSLLWTSTRSLYACTLAHGLYNMLVFVSA